MASFRIIHIIGTVVNRLIRIHRASSTGMLTIIIVTFYVIFVVTLYDFVIVILFRNLMIVIIHLFYIAQFLC